jgi:sugar/nucleoside kinase (ribokinase family)
MGIGSHSQRLSQKIWFALPSSGGLSTDFVTFLPYYFMSILVAGTVALDSIETPTAKQADCLGGSASYAALAAALLTDGVQLCSIVGTDFPKQHLDLFQSKRINLANLQVEEGKTFRWSGRYFEDMNNRETLSVSVDVLEKFKPTLNDAAKNARVVLLANMHPLNQLDVLDQVDKRAFIVADSMDLWIDIAKNDLLRVLERADLFVINESEAKMFTGTGNLITAGHRLRAMGPKQVVVKKGEHGAMLFGEGHFFSTTAFPLTELADPTGAGDTFAGGMASYLANLNKSKDEITFVDMNRAVAFGSVVASFTCEALSTDRLAALTLEELDARRELFRNYTAF